MTCDFTSFLTVFQSYQEGVWMIMKENLKFQLREFQFQIALKNLRNLAYTVCLTLISMTSYLLSQQLRVNTDVKVMSLRHYYARY